MSNVIDPVVEPVVEPVVPVVPPVPAGTSGAAANVAAAAAPEASKPWMSQAPDELKKNELLSTFEGVGPLCEGYVNLHGELVELKKTMEVPEGEDGYKLGEPVLPDGFPKDADLEVKFKKFCLENKIGQGQAKSLFEFYNASLGERYSGVMQARSTAETDTEKKLKGEWGEDGYNEKIAMIGKLVTAKAGADAVHVMEVLDKAGANGDAATVKCLAAIASDYGQHKFIEGETLRLQGTGEPEPQPGAPKQSVKYKEEFTEYAKQG